MNYNDIAVQSVKVFHDTMDDTKTVSLDDIVKQKYQEISMRIENEKLSVMDSINNDVSASTNAEKLLQIQQTVMNHNIELSLMSVIARKVTNAVETLTRS